jgi:hypothetical protein
MVQVALPYDAPRDVDKYLLAALTDALDEAEQWAVRRRVARDLGSLRAICTQL